MAGGYESRPDGAEFFTREFRDIWAAIRAISGANKLESAVIGNGGITVEGGGSIGLTGGGDVSVRDGGGIEVLDGGEISVRGTGSARGMRLVEGDLRLFADLGVPSYTRLTTSDDAVYLRPPGPVGSDDATALVLEGTRAGRNGNAFLLADAGQMLVRSKGAAFLRSDQDSVQINAFDRVGITGDRIELIAGTKGTGVFGTPTTSGASNVFLGTVGGQWQLARSTSSRRYKTDEAPSQIDTAEVLSLAGKSWLDIYEMDNGPEGDVKRNVGFIAEDLDERPSLRQFVDYDDEGRPDAIQYDRLSVALLEVAKDQEARLSRMEERLTVLEDRSKP